MQQPLEKIDKYQILSVLGKGAMGIVYHAYDPVVKRDVAIKLLSSFDSEETELISRFEREARLAGGLRHPNIVTIYDLGHHNGRPYIVMEYIVGRDLEAVIRQKLPLTYEQRVEIILQICKGLHAAHQKGIIHRDIKPANVRLQDDMMVRIMDFGIARMGTSQLTKSGYIIGTLQYMSPEQISGEQLDPRTDIFSTGTIAYELFTHSNPFNGEHTVDIMYRILNVRPQPIQELPEEHGTELNQIIMRALEKNRDLRYHSAKEMEQDLEEYLFFLKSLKFRHRIGSPAVPVPEGVTQVLPLDKLPVVTPQEGKRQDPPTINAVPRNQTISTVSLPVPETPVELKTSQPTPTTIPPLTLTHEGEGWRDKKFYVLGAVVALLFIGGLVWMSNRKPTPPLTVLSTPPGAEVLVNGAIFGKTPVRIDEPRNLQLTFRLDGYQEQTISLSPAAWPDNLHITLEKVPEPVVPKAHVIQVQSEPPGALISLDGKEIGKTPTNIELTDEAAHQLAFQLDGYQPVEKNIDKKSGETLSVTLEQQIVPGTVQYSGKYPVILSSSGQSGRTIELPSGKHTISVRARQKAYIRATRTVEVNPGETVRITDPPMGTLSISAIPGNCKIYINGEYLDVSPIFSLPVQAGNHTIRFLWSTGKQLNKQITVTQGSSETIRGVAPN